MKEEKIEAEINSLPIVQHVVFLMLVAILIIMAFDRPTYSSDYTDVIIFLFIVEICIIVNTIRSLIIWNTTKLYFTKNKIAGKLGVFNTTTLDAPLNKINDIFIAKSLFGRILNYSKIVINTSSNKYSFNYISNADKFKDRLTEYIVAYDSKDINQKNNNKSNYDELKKIKELLDNGILTQEEYEKEKYKLLNN